MAKQSWPAWFYGPKGEAAIFQSQGDVPAGWEDDPSKVREPSKVKKLGVDDNLNGVESIPEIRAALAEGRVTADAVEKAENTRSSPRKGVVGPGGLLEQYRAYQAQREGSLKLLRSAGIEVSDDATDDEINEALDALEAEG
jgi:hypothetical protein